LQNQSQENWSALFYFAAGSGAVSCRKQRQKIEEAHKFPCSGENCKLQLTKAQQRKIWGAKLNWQLFSSPWQL
jgi:hypothetical protein